MSDTLDPNAIADDGSGEFPNAQDVDYDMILAYVLAEWGWPNVAAEPFAGLAHDVWYEYNDGSGTQTNGQILAGILAYWRGEV
jgi:hypothetical protein